MVSPSIGSEFHLSDTRYRYFISPSQENYRVRAVWRTQDETQYPGLLAFTPTGSDYVPGIYGVDGAGYTADRVIGVGSEAGMTLMPFSGWVPSSALSIVPWP